MSARATAGAVLAAAVAGVTTWVVGRALTRRQPGGNALWERKNFRGSVVNLSGGPAAAAGAAAGIAMAPGLPPRVRVAGLAASTAVAAVGLYDDFVPALDQSSPWARLAGSEASKGFRGHLGALRRGEVTSGLLKIGVIGVTGAAAGALVSRNATDALIGGAAVAGHANLINLLDLRPGRAAKALALHAPLVLGGPAAAVGAAAVGAAVAGLPDDLGERTMLGDSGANALGALVGLAMVARESRRARLLHLAVVSALIVASEKVSFTQVIERTPVLRAVDELGRRP